MFYAKNSDINHLHFEENFAINKKNGNMVVFAPNGTGKTSIYEEIKKNFPDYFYIDYEDYKDNFLKENEKTVILGPKISQLEKLKETKEMLADEYNPYQYLRELGITNKGKASKVYDGFENHYKDNIYLLENFTTDKINLFEDFQDYREFIISNFSLILENQELEEDIRVLKSGRLNKLYQEVRKYVEPGTTKCPICDQDLEKSVEEVIQARMKEKKIKVNELSEKMIESYPEKGNEEIKDILDEILEIVRKSEFNEQDILSLAIYNAENLEELEEAKKEINKQNIKIRDMEKKLNDFYDRIATNSHYITELSKIFIIPKKNITLVPEKKRIVVKLERDLTTYSTGELNAAIFISSLYDFIQSDAEWLIADDPISSFDLTNQYRIIYELLAKALQSERTRNKKALIFTHNFDVVNIIHSQHPQIFKYYAIDKLMNSDGRKINWIKELHLNSKHPSISLKTVLDSSFKDGDFLDKIYLEALIERENDEKTSLHKVFHYDGEDWEVSYKGHKISNCYLLKKIEEGFDVRSFQESSYFNVVLKKIIHIVSLRVWVEKKLYEGLKEEHFKKKWQSGDLLTLQEKINYALPRKGDARVDYEKLNRDTLMSKKSMLNQGSHYGAMSAPFLFAANVSLETLQREEKEIKDLFLK